MSAEESTIHRNGLEISITVDGETIKFTPVGGWQARENWRWAHDIAADARLVFKRQRQMLRRQEGDEGLQRYREVLREG